MEVEKFLTKEMWKAIPKPAQRLISFELTSGYQHGYEHVLDALFKLKGRKYLEYYSWQIFGIFAEEVIEVTHDTYAWLFARMVDWLPKNMDGKSEDWHTYPHLPMFEYMNEKLSYKQIRQK